MDTVDFDPGAQISNLVAPGGQTDAFLLKMDSSGNLVWAKQFTGIGAEVAYAIVLDDQENLIVVGSFRDTADFDPGSGTFLLSTDLYDDAFIAKLDTTGNLIWAKQLAGNNNQIAYGVAVNANGDINLTGSFQGTTDFDPGSGTFNLVAGSVDAFVAKVDQYGAWKWAVKIGGGSTSNAGKGIATDSKGNVLTTGYFDSALDFDPGPSIFTLTAAGSDDIFIQKLDSSGDFVWANRIGGASLDQGYAIEADGTGNAYFSGTFHGGPVDFDPGTGTFNLTSAGLYDIFVEKVDTSGNFSWAVKIGGNGGSNDDRGKALSINGKGNVFTTGYFRDTPDFDPGSGVLNMASQGLEDIFIHKMCQPTSSNVPVTACDSFSLPGSGDTYYADGVYPDTIPNSGGCDSLMSFSLTVLQSTFNTFADTACNAWILPGGGTAGISGTYLDTIPNAAGCDSVLTIALTIQQSSSVSVFPSVCDTTFLSPSGKYTWSVSGIFSDTIANLAGCDSLISINLFVGTSTAATVSFSTCDSSFVSPSGKYIWTSAGSYQDTIPNSAGCDSLLTLTIQFVNETFDTINPSVCDASYLSPSGKYLWTISGTYNDTIINSNGCDSIMTINLSVNFSTLDSIADFSCESTYQSPSGKWIWTTTGSYLDTATTVAGCDSILYIDLIFIDLDTSISPGTGLLFANEVAATYQWMDCDSMAIIPGATGQLFQPPGSGNFAVILTQNVCSDTSECHSLIIVNSGEPNLQYNFMLFPNPTSGELTVDFGGQELSVTITITDVKGSRLAEIRQAKKSHSICTNLDWLVPGLYFLKIEMEDGATERIKFIRM